MPLVPDGEEAAAADWRGRVWSKDPVQGEAGIREQSRNAAVELSRVSRESVPPLQTDELQSDLDARKLNFLVFGAGTTERSVEGVLSKPAQPSTSREDGQGSFPEFIARRLGLLAWDLAREREQVLAAEAAEEVAEMRLECGRLRLKNHELTLLLEREKLFGKLGGGITMADRGASPEEHGLLSNTIPAEEDQFSTGSRSPMLMSLNLEEFRGDVALMSLTNEEFRGDRDAAADHMSEESIPVFGEPRWEPCDGRLGVYIITRNSIVRGGVSLKSQEITSLAPGARVTVLELLHCRRAQRVRARIFFEPSGWITLRNTETGMQWASPCINDGFEFVVEYCEEWHGLWNRLLDEQKRSHTADENADAELVAISDAQGNRVALLDVTGKQQFPLHARYRWVHSQRQEEPELAGLSLTSSFYGPGENGDTSMEDGQVSGCSVM